MKNNPKHPKIPTPKTRYIVEIDSLPLTTYAVSDKGAVSNAAYQYARAKGEDVKLIQWRIKNGELEWKIVEGEPET